MADNSNAPNHDERIKKLEKQVAELKKDFQALNKKVSSLENQFDRQRNRNRKPY